MSKRQENGFIWRSWSWNESGDACGQEIWSESGGVLGSASSGSGISASYEVDCDATWAAAAAFCGGERVCGAEDGLSGAAQQTQ